MHIWKEPRYLKDENKVWKREALACRQTAGVPSTFHPWTGRRAFQGAGLPRTARIFEILDCIAIVTCKDAGLAPKDMNTAVVQRLLHGAFVDVSQSFSRRAWALRNEDLPTFTTSTTLYSFSDDRVVTGREMLQMHGHSPRLSVPDSLTEENLRELAGEGMALPSLGLVVWSLFLCKRFPEMAP